MKSKKNKKGNWKQKTANPINFAFEAKVKGFRFVKRIMKERIHIIGCTTKSLINKLKYHTTEN